MEIGALSKYSLCGLRGTSLICWVAIIGCRYDPDPRSIRGAMDGAARAIEANDGKRLFRYIDQRAQHALGGIVAARTAARKLIERDYPPSDRGTAIAALGDGANFPSGAALFASRCNEHCMQRIGSKLGAPLEEQPAGDEVAVRTSRGATLNVFAGSHGWYGIVWRSQALSDERDRASRELRQVEQNAAIYRKRRALAPP